MGDQINVLYLNASVILQAVGVGKNLPWSVINYNIYNNE